MKNRLLITVVCSLVLATASFWLLPHHPPPANPAPPPVAEQRLQDGRLARAVWQDGALAVTLDGGAVLLPPDIFSAPDTVRVSFAEEAGDVLLFLTDDKTAPGEGTRLTIRRGEVIVHERLHADGSATSLPVTLSRDVQHAAIPAAELARLRSNPQP